MEKNILVLGGTGFIGSRLIKALLKQGYNVNAFVHKNGFEFKHENLKLFRGDVCKEQDLAAAFDNVGIVINLVGQTTLFWEYYDLNTIGTLNILNECVRNEIRKIVFTSSVKVYGSNFILPSHSREVIYAENVSPNPVSQEGIIKFTAEKLHRYYAGKYNIPVVCLRLSNVYGPRQKKGVLYNFVNDILKGNTITINDDGTQRHSFIYIDDVVSAIINAIRYDCNDFEVFNISNDKTISINELLDIVQGNLGKKTSVCYQPISQETENFNMFDNQKAKRKLGYEMRTTLEMGVQESCKSLKQKIEET